MNIVIDESVVAGYQTALEDSLNWLKGLKEQYSALKEQADADQLLTIKEACDYLRCNEDTLLYYRNKAGLPYFKKGQSVWYRKGDIDQWLAAGYVNRHQR